VKFGVSLSLFFFCCCSASIQSSSTSYVNKQSSSGENQTVTIQEKDQNLPRILKEDFKIARAWKNFTQDGKYRLANGSDFRIPDWAIKASYLEPRQYEQPFLTTRFGHAAIGIDTTRNDESRFGLVILDVDEGTASDEDNTIHWLYRDKDLSRAVLGSSSGGLYVVEYEENGTMVTCFVDWDESQQKYICKHTYINKIN